MFICNHAFATDFDWDDNSIPRAWMDSIKVQILKCIFLLEDEVGSLPNAFVLVIITTIPNQEKQTEEK